MQDVLNLPARKIASLNRDALESIASVRFQLDRFAQALRPLVQGVNATNLRMEESIRPTLQRLNAENLRMEESTRPARQALSDLAERMGSCFGQVDLGANIRAALLGTSAPSFDVEAHRPKGGSKPAWMRKLIKGLILKFVDFQIENKGRKLFKADFCRILSRLFPVSDRVIEEIWKQVRGDWQSKGRPTSSTLAAKISEKEIEVHFADLRRELIKELHN